VDSSWADEPDRYSTHAGCEFIGSHLIESWVVTDQVRALSSAEAELYGIVDGSARGIMTQSLMSEIGSAWSADVACDSSAAISISSKSGVGKTRHIATRWLWIQDAVRNKQVKLHKIAGATNVADMGTKCLEPKRHQELMKLLPLAPPTSKRFLAVLTALSTAASSEGAPIEMQGRDCGGPSAMQQFVTHLTYVFIILATIVCVRVWDRVSGGYRSPRRTADVSSQTPTTYTEVRGAAQPRFRVLPQHLQG
jgi:hypothetical protein